MKKLVCFFLFLLSLGVGQAQNAYLNGLEDQLNRTTDETKQADLNYRIADWYRINDEYNRAITTVNRYLEARGEHLSEFQKAKFNALLSNIYLNDQDFEKAGSYVEEAMDAAKRAAEPMAKIYAYYASGILQMAFNDQKAAIENFLTALRYGDDATEAQLRAKTYYQLYAIYAEWNNIEKSVEYIDKAIALGKQGGNKNELANYYDGKAVTYSLLHDAEPERAEQHFDSLMHNLEKGIRVYRKFTDEVASNTITHLYGNRAAYLLKYQNADQPEIQQAITANIDTLLQIADPQKDEVSMANAFGILSELSRKENDLDQAGEYLNRAYSLLIQKESPYYYTLINVTNALSEVSAAQGDYLRAFELQKEARSYTHLVFDQEQLQIAEKLETQYQLQAKEEQIDLLEEKAQSQQKIKRLLLGLLGIALIGAFFIFRSYHFKLKYSLSHSKQLEAERKEAELKIQLEREERERLKAEQKVMDLERQKLQDEVMAGQLQLEHKNRVLKDLEHKLNNNKEVNIRQLLRKEGLSDQNFDEAKFKIKEIHPDFFNNLAQNTDQNLSPTDLKYCAYLYLGMDTKDIALLLNVEPKSVRMAKYRLKKKFKLDAETDLIEFINRVG